MLASPVALRFLFSGLLLAMAQVAHGYTGDATAYGNDWRGGACLYQDLPTPAKTNFLAINQVLWDSMGMQNLCGRCVRMTYGGNTAVGMITNRCPECAVTAVDLSDSLFKELTGSSPSRLTISWDIVDCGAEMGVSGAVNFYTKDGVNPNWLAVQPINFGSPIKSLSIEYPSGKMTEMTYGASGLNYYIAAGLGINGKYTLHATDAEGNTHSASSGSVSSGSYILSGGSSIFAASQITSEGGEATPSPVRHLRLV